MLQIQPLQKGLINKCMLTNTNAHMHILHVILKKTKKNPVALQAEKQ